MNHISDICGHAHSMLSKDPHRASMTIGLSNKGEVVNSVAVGTSHFPLCQERLRDKLAGTVAALRGHYPLLKQRKVIPRIPERLTLKGCQELCLQIGYLLSTRHLVRTQLKNFSLEEEYELYQLFAAGSLSTERLNKLTPGDLKWIRLHCQALSAPRAGCLQQQSARGRLVTQPKPAMAIYREIEKIGREVEAELGPHIVQGLQTMRYAKVQAWVTSGGVTETQEKPGEYQTRFSLKVQVEGQRPETFSYSYRYSTCFQEKTYRLWGDKSNYLPVTLYIAEKSGSYEQLRNKIIEDIADTLVMKAYHQVRH